MRYVAATLSLLLLTGCATTTGTVETNSAVCSVWRPVTWSTKDTDQTIREVKVSNARRKGYCGE
jgi:outer membrane biogenesis lipoprotein LolB